MATFLIEFDNFNKKYKSLEAILKAYETQWLIDFGILTNYVLDQELSKIRNFPRNLKRLVEDAIPESPNHKDIFGNVYDRGSYQYVEVTTGGQAKFQTIRFLGTVNGEKKRYYLSNIVHNFEPTTINFLEKLDDIIAPNCNIVQMAVEAGSVNSKYSWNQIAKTIFSPPAVVNVDTNQKLTSQALIAINERMRENFLTAEQMEERNKKVNELKSKLFEKSEEDTDSAPSVASEIKKAIETSSPPDFASQFLNQLEEKDPSKACRDTIDTIAKTVDRFKTGKIALEALDCILPGSCEEVVRRLPVEQLTRMILKVYPKDCELVKNVEGAIDRFFHGNARFYKEEIEKYKLLIEEQEKRVEQIERVESYLKNIDNILSKDSPPRSEKKQVFTTFVIVDDLVPNEEKRNELSKICIDTLQIINLLETNPNDNFAVNRNSLIQDNFIKFKTIYKEEISGLNSLEQLKKNIESNKKYINGASGLGQDLEKSFRDEIQERFQSLQLTERQRGLFDYETLNMNKVYSNFVIGSQEQQIYEQNKNELFDVINAIIPLSSLCDLIPQLADMLKGLLNNGFPKPRPVSDIFAELSALLIALFIQLICEMLLMLVQTIIDNILNCSNIDALLSAALDGNFGVQLPEFSLDDVGAASEVFASDVASNLVDELDKNGLVSAVGQVFANAGGSLWAAYYESLKIDEKIEQKIEASKQEQQEPLTGPGTYIFDYKQLQDKKYIFNNWDIDENGKSLIVSYGDRTIKMQDLDVDVKKSVEQAVNSIPAELLTEGVFVKLTSMTNQSPQPQPQTQGLVSFPPAEIMKNELQDAISSFTSIATPSEAVYSLAGEMKDDSAALALEILKNRTPNLQKLFDTPEKVKDLFSSLGKASGLDQMLESFQLIASLPEAQNKLVSSKLCAPFNNIDSFRKSLLSSVAPSPEIANEIIDNINNEKFNQYAELLDAFLNLTEGKASPMPAADPARALMEEIKDKIFNAPTLASTEPTSLDSEEESELDKFRRSGNTISEFMRDQMNQVTQNDPMYKSMLDTTLDSIMSPIKDGFNSAMRGMLNGFSSEKEVERKIYRTIKQDKRNSKGQKIGGKEEVINQEFKDFLIAGLVPVLEEPSDEYVQMWNKDSLEIDGEGNLIDDRITGNPNTDYITENWSIKRLLEKPFSLGFEDKNRLKKPIIKKEIKKTLGDSFKNSLIKKSDTEEESVIDVDLTYNSYNIKVDNFEIQNSEISKLIENSEKLPAESQNILPGSLNLQELKNNIPNWNISFSEDYSGYTKKSKLEIYPAGFLITAAGGKKQFSKPLVKNYDKILVDEETERLLEKTNLDISRPMAFCKLTRNAITNKLYLDEERQRPDNNIVPKLLDIHKKISNSLSEKLLRSLNNTRLFDETSIGNEETGGKLYFLQLFDFSREATPQEQERGFDPNIMGFKQLQEKFTEIYNNEPEVENQVKNGRTAIRNRFTNSCYKLMIEVIVRLGVIDFCIKSLPILESLKFSKLFLENELLKQFLIEKVKEFTETMELESQFRREFNKILEPGQKYDEVLGEKIIENFENILDKFASIFHICDHERKSDMITEMVYNSLEVLDMHNTIPVPRDVDTYFYKINRKVNTVYEKSQFQEFLEESFTNTNTIDFEDPLALEETRKSILEYLEDVKEQYEGSSTELWSSKLVYENIEEQIVKDGDMYLETYVKIGRINPNIPFTSLNVFQNTIVSLKLFKYICQKYKEFFNTSNTDTPLFDCEENGVFLEQPKFGIRLMTMVKSNTPRGKFLDSWISSESLDDKIVAVEGLYQTNERNYNVLELHRTEVPMKKDRITFDEFIGLCDNTEGSTYSNEIYPILKKQIVESPYSKIFFNYCFGLKEIVAVAAMHSYHASSNESIKYLFSSLSNTIKETLVVLDNFGDKTKTAETLSNMRMMQKENMDNEGNPAGPLNMDLVKIFLRTPIHILRGLATIVDPNIFISNLIISGISIAGTLIGQKLWLPYGIVSLSLLPAPIFMPPWAPSLTAYNIALPLGPIFLVLEPLLWDLPWYANMNTTLQNPENNQVLASYGIGPDSAPCPDEAEMLAQELKSLAPGYDNMISGEVETSFLDYAIQKIKEECGSLE